MNRMSCRRLSRPNAELYRVALLGITVVICLLLPPARNCPTPLLAQDPLEKSSAEIDRVERRAEISKLDLQYSRQVAAGDLEEALASAQRIMELERGLFPADDYHWLNTLSRVAESLAYCDRFDEAQAIAQSLYKNCLVSRGERWWRSVDARILLEDIARLKSQPGETRSRMARAWQIACNINQLLIAGRIDLAQREAEESLSICRELLGDLHPMTLDAHFKLANTADWSDHDEEALRLFKVNVELCKKAYSNDMCPKGHPKTALALYFVAHLTRGKGNREEAAKYLTESLDIRRQVYPLEYYPNGHMDIIRSLHQLGQIKEDYSTEIYKESQAHYDEALALLRKLNPPDEYSRGSALLVDCLSSCADIRRGRGRLAEALPFRFEAVDVCRRLYPREEYPHGTSPFASALRKLANTLSLLSRRAEALTLLEEALPMYEAAYSQDEFPQGHPSLSAFYQDLGLAYVVAQFPSKGLRYARQAVSMNRTFYAGDRHKNGHVTLLFSLTKLADFLTANRLLHEVPPLLKEAEAMANSLFPIERFPNGHSSFGEIQYRWGHYYFNQGQLAAARNSFSKALENYERIFPPERAPIGNVHLAKCLEMMGATLHKQGEFLDAVSFYERNLSMRIGFFPEDTHPDGHQDLIAAYQNLAMPLGRLKRYKEAESHLRNALKITNNLFPKTSYPNGIPALAYVNDNLGICLLSQDRFEEAAECFAESLRISRKLYPRSRYPLGHDSQVYAMMNLTDALVRVGVPTDQWRAISDEFSEMSEALYPRTIFPHGHPLLLDTLSKRSSDLLLMEEIETAQEILERLVEMKLEYAWYEMSHTATDILVRYMYNLQFEYDKLLSLVVLKSDNDPELLARIYRWGAMQKSIVMDALLRNQRVKREAADNPQVAALEANVRKMRHELAALTMKPSTDARPEDQREAQRHLANQLQTAESELLLTLNQRDGEEPGQVFSLELIERWLADHPHTAVIEIVEYSHIDPGISESNDLNRRGARYVALVLSNGRQLQLVDLGSATVLDNKIEELREFVSNTTRLIRFSSEEALEMEYAHLANELYELVFGPLKPHLNGIDTICLALDGELNRVPIHALVNDEGQYLIEDYAFGFLSSSSDLVRTKSPPGEGVVIFADPDYDLDSEVLQELVVVSPVESDTMSVRSALTEATRGLSWSPLPATGLEAELIDQLFSSTDIVGAVSIYTEDSALEDWLKQIRSPKILHLATHGYYLEHETNEEAYRPREPSVGSNSPSRVQARLKGTENPLLRSGMVLAGANTLLADDDQSTITEDGWVTAEEVAMLDLLGTELVVLSACETGLGDLRAGENVSGLRRAFVQAGAQRLVTSLYKVPDSATQELMGEFYKRIVRGMSPLDALRDAQLTMIAQRRETQGAAHPFFWASFILVGDPD